MAELTHIDEGLTAIRREGSDHARIHADGKYVPPSPGQVIWASPSKPHRSSRPTLTATSAPGTPMRRRPWMRPSMFVSKRHAKWNQSESDPLLSSYGGETRRVSVMALADAATSANPIQATAAPTGPV